MNRRAFLHTTAAALAASAFTRADDAPKKRALKKAVNLGMIGGGASVMDRFKMAKDAGFDGLDSIARMRSRSMNC